jgi:hypothetical protein
MYVAGLEGYLSGSRETLVRNGHELPRVQRSATSRGLDGPTKIVRNSILFVWISFGWGRHEY